MENKFLVCDHCNNSFQVSSNLYKQKIYQKRKLNLRHLCSEKCRFEVRGISEKQQCVCSNCNNTFMKKMGEIKRSKNNFCSSSCAASFNNKNKKYGIRRSKLEIYIERELTALYPNFEIHFNRKDAINSELDIYMPSLKLAFELNGIFHYEPIHGSDRLAQIKNNDNRKFQACLEKGIELCIIDTSSQKYFKESKSLQYLNIILDIINKKHSIQCCV